MIVASVVRRNWKGMEMGYMKSREAKRLLAGATALAFAAVAFTGCASSDAPEATPEATAEATGQLTILSVSNNQLGLDSAIERFKAKYPDVDVKVDYADTNGVATTLRTQLLAGTAPDVFTTWPGYSTVVGSARLAPSGYFADLSNYSFSEEIPAAFDELTSYKGKRTMLPYSLNYVGAFYNKNAVEEIGAKVPTTYSEILDFCDAATAAGKVAFGYAAQTGFAVQLFNYAFTATLLDSDFYDEMEAGKATFSDSEWVDAFDKLLEMRDRGCFQNGYLASPIEEVVGMVARGEALATVSTSATLGSLKAAADESTEFGMFALPATKKAADTILPASAGNGYALNSKAKNPTAGQLFLEFLGDPKEAAVTADVQGVAPMVASAWTKPPVLAPLFDHLDAGTVSPLVDQLWPNPEVNIAQQEGTQAVLGGQTTAAELLATMDDLYAQGNN